ncbi:aryl-alcohol dehydrogenase-like predicted oxidoreductase [Paenibacillus sp. JGP012]|uniref:aldo/keto reductase n=1 Tax=Paenibacillus sp. JGP012 TaxID=2735914 RepID=UPI00161E0919|nr:aldo/keto reductase [Paenibacillus sp. JGP012]MBB6019473.1 aryl-alcohol dehydrogenase-like predicted oxidoreductase [Paenibacillus sp. JGP012]
MRQLSLGKSGPQVSALCLGCLNFGTKTDKSLSYQLLDQYVEAGGNFLDTSNNYAFWNGAGVGGQSETLLGEWMKEKGNRDRIFLATKVGANPTIPGGGFPAKEGLSKKAIHKAVDESLKRLQTDYIDLYYAHIDDMDVPLEETLDAFNQLVQSGKVRTIGCSNHYTWRLEEARSISQSRGFASYQCIQQRYTYLRPRPGADFDVQISVSEEMLKYIETHEEIALLAYSPLLSGAYSRQDRPIPVQYAGLDAEKRIAVLQEISKETGATHNQVILAWMLSNSPVALPLIAASSTEQLQENLHALDVTLTQEQIKRLNEATY